MSKTIADEICDCGHSKKSHGPHPLDKHGDKCNQCPCKIYTWASFVFAEDLIEITALTGSEVKDAS